MRRARPHREKRRALEEEAIAVRGNGEAIEDPLDGVSREHELKFFAAFLDKIQEAPPNRGGDISDGRLRHASASR